jgi:hypothetical protein
VACQRDFETAAERGAVNCGNNRLRRVLHQDKHFGETRGVRRLAELGDVGAGDEGAAAAGQHDRLHFGIGDRRFMQSNTAARGTQRVDGRTVNRDDGNNIMTLDLTASFTDSPGYLFLDGFLTCVEKLRRWSTRSVATHLRWWLHFCLFRTAKFNSTP